MNYPGRWRTLKETVLDICEGEPGIEVCVHTANLTDGMLI
jgi:hypothetical protein